MMRFLLLALLTLTALPAPAAEPAAPPPKFHAQPQAVPGYRYQAIDGTAASLDPYLTQKVLVVNFWATWCPPCVKELPSLDRLAAALPHDRFQVIAVAQQTETAEVIGYFRRASIRTLQPFMDPNLGAGRAFGLRGLPTTIIVNGDGQIVGRVEGDIEWDAPGVVAWLKTL